MVDCGLESHHLVAYVLSERGKCIFIVESCDVDPALSDIMQTHPCDLVKQQTNLCIRLLSVTSSELSRKCVPLVD